MMMTTKRLRAAVLVATFMGVSAAATGTPWKSYLCTYGKSEQRLLIKINVDDRRVKVDDRDAGDVKFSDGGSFTFNGPRGTSWFVAKSDGPVASVTVMERTNPPEQGLCRAVDD